MEIASTLACGLDIFCTVNGHSFITVNLVIQSIIFNCTKMIKEVNTGNMDAVHFQQLHYLEIQYMHNLNTLWTFKSITGSHK